MSLLSPDQPVPKEGEVLLALDTNTSVALGRALNSIFKDDKLALIQGHLTEINKLHPKPFLKGRDDSVKSTQDMEDALGKIIDFVKKLQSAEKVNVVYDEKMHSPNFDFVGQNNLASGSELPDTVLGGENFETIKNIILHNIANPLTPIWGTINFAKDSSHNEDFKEHCGDILELVKPMSKELHRQFGDPQSIKITKSMGQTVAIPIPPTTPSRT